MKIKNCLPNIGDCMGIYITKDTWIFVECIAGCGFAWEENENEFLCELHHRTAGEVETLLVQDFLEISGEEQKNSVKRMAIDEAIWLLPVLYLKETDRHLADIYYEALADIWFETKQYLQKDLAQYMVERKSKLEW